MIDKLRQARRRTPRLTAAAALLLSSLTVPASEIERAEILFSGATYQYTFVAVLAGTRDAVRAIATDYDRLGRVNDDIIESRVIERYSASELKRVLRVKQCILLICFDLDFVERVSETPDRIITTIIPAESSFVDGSAAWYIQALDAQHTRITVNAIQTPDFWIPPVLGPLILKRAFLREIEETCANIERLAQTPAPLP